jgi:hypothetical protein
LGYVSAIDSTVIHWPNGSSWTTTSLKPNTAYTLRFPNEITKIFEAVHTIDTKDIGIIAFYSGNSISLDVQQSELRNVTVSVLDVLGNTMQKMFYPILENEIISLPTISYSSGLYFVRIESKDYSKTLKVTIIK